VVGGVEVNPDRDGDFAAWAERYFAAKSRHDLDALVGHFGADIAYEDAVLGRRTTGRDRMRDTYAAVFAAYVSGSAGSTLAWSAGGRAGGAVQFHNDAGLFGAPMHVIAVIELVDGRVARQRDYWDGRMLPAATLTAMRDRYPAHQPPRDLPPPQRFRPPGALADAARLVRQGLESGRDLSDLLTADATLHDLGDGARLAGSGAVAAYLADAADRLPYGRGARETNLVGAAVGGAWEWAAAPAWADSVGAGVTAVRLDPDGRVAELTIAWDTSRIDPWPVRPRPRREEAPRRVTLRPRREEAPRPVTPRPCRGEAPRPVTPRPRRGEAPRPVTPRPRRGEAPRPGSGRREDGSV
jgi:ketosteroid isomerase-like protein